VGTFLLKQKHHIMMVVMKDNYPKMTLVQVGPLCLNSSRSVFIRLSHPVSTSSSVIQTNPNFIKNAVKPSNLNFLQIVLQKSNVLNHPICSRSSHFFGPSTPVCVNIGYPSIHSLIIIIVLGLNSPFSET